MKILLIWPTPKPEVKLLLDEIESAGHEIVYWVGERPSSHLTPLGAIFHDHYDAWGGKPADEYRTEAFPPPSAKRIASLFELESLILTMMNKHYDAVTVDERKHIYYTMLGYWEAVLERLKPDAVVFNDVPHSLYSNIVFDLARERGIRTVMFEGTLVAGTVIRYRDFWKGSEEMAAAVKRNMGSIHSPEALSPSMRAYWEEHASVRDYSERWYMKEQESKTRGMGMLRIRVRAALSAIQRGNFLTLVMKFVLRAFKKDLKDEYREVETRVDFSRQFVYFPLGFQPERTTSPQGGVYHDQILVAETLAAALPDGWELYIKEHPSQWFLRTKAQFSSARYSGYYRRLSHIPRARVVPIDTQSRKLVDTAQAVATITGTSGLEALLWGKIPLVFGTAWYRDCPGVRHVRSVEACRQAFADIARGENVKKEDVLAFFKALDEVALHTNVGEKEKRISDEEEMRVYARSIVDALGSGK